MFNFRILIAILLIGVTGYYGILSGGPTWKLFFNQHALVLVFLGTVSVFVFSNSFQRIMSILKLVNRIIFYDIHTDRVQFIYTLYYISAIKERNLPVQNFPSIANNPFLVDAIKLLNSVHLSDEDFLNTLTRRLDLVVENYSEDAEALTSLAKYPPAMGLLGATSGMIGMMMNIGNADKTAIGSSMATALIATLWGIGVANFIILPLSDLTVRMNNEHILNRKMISDTMMLIKMKKDTSTVLDFILSYAPYEEKRKVEAICINWHKSNIAGQFFEKI